MINKTDMEIKSRWIAEPPEKVRLMYEAVCAFIREHTEISALKVRDITARAGIGKGTAYEYFSSKEEIVLHAVLYEYFRQTREMEEKVFAPDNFRDRFWAMLDWIRDNQEYNRLFSWTIQDICHDLAGAGFPESSPDIQSGSSEDFKKQAGLWVFGIIRRFMDYGFQQQVFTESDPKRQTLALFSAVIQYTIAATAPQPSPLQFQSEEELRIYVYRSMIAALSLPE